MTDFNLQDHGSIWLLVPQSNEARAWTDKYLSHAQTWGPAACVVEPRYIVDIVTALREEGFTL